MQTNKKVKLCYDETAGAYADKFVDELNSKHLDRLLLNAFAHENKAKGTLIDLGCGPGETTAYLKSLGVTDLIGTDISTGMIEKAKQLFPAIDFEEADMLSLKYNDDSFGSATAFYAIVHFDEDALQKALTEIYRVLKKNGDLLLSFHIGNEIIHYDTFLEKDVEIDFYMWETLKVTDIAHSAGFETIDIIERYPYPDVEYPSKRAYVWLKK